MASLKDSANTYEPPTTKNIADLPDVSVDLSLEPITGKNNENGIFN